MMCLSRTLVPTPEGPSSATVSPSRTSKSTPSNTTLSRKRLQVRQSLFFQAEDGIRDYKVTGVQTCALPIFGGCESSLVRLHPHVRIDVAQAIARRIDFRAADRGRAVENLSLQIREIDGIEVHQIGRASCRERV